MRKSNSEKRSGKLHNPLTKRILREFRQDIGRNIAIFIFIAVTIGFISGFLVADNSMKAAYDNSFEKYNIEDGNFELITEIDEDIKRRIEGEDVTLYENFFVEKEAENNTNDKNDKVVRIFINREEVNKASIIKGKLPQNKGEIALDRLFAIKNKYKLGETAKIGGEEYKITGLIALSDYSALFSDNNDLMFDATNFCVAVVTKEQFEEYMDGKLHYSYSWKLNDKGLSAQQKEKLNENIKSILIKENAGALSFITEADNQAIHFTGDDMGSDKNMMIVLLYLIIVILAFIFAVTTMSTIDKEAAVIGTLRASGYTRGEMLRHYIASPILNTFAASVIGNILGYTVFKKVVVAMYYNSYSLPVYVTLWNADAFILTTIIPAIVMMIVNVLVISVKLRLSPLKFLRHDLKKSRKARALRLPDFSFIMRFKLRVILQNSANYLVMLIGVLFASILSLFGLMMIPLLNHSGDEIIDHMKGEYQYILQMPVETENENAEKCIMGSLVTKMKGAREDEVTVYGIEEDTRYFKGINLAKDTQSVVVSDAVLEKYRLKVGDKVKFESEFTNKTYEFKIRGSYYYPQGLALFLGSEQYREIFELDEGYFNAYLSDERLDDIDEKMIITKITKTDMLKVTNQLNDSFGAMMPLFAAFAVLMSMLIIYLLSKVVIEKNAMSISMVKILGYNDKEVSNLYVSSTGIVAILSALISIPLSYYSMEMIYYIFMRDFAGWVSYYVKPVVFAEVLGITVVSYVAVAFVLYKKIKRIPMGEVLKNAE